MGMNLAGLKHMAGGRVMGSEVEGAGNEGHGKVRQGVWIY